MMLTDRTFFDPAVRDAGTTTAVFCLVLERTHTLGKTDIYAIIRPMLLQVHRTSLVRRRSHHCICTGG